MLSNWCTCFDRNWEFHDGNSRIFLSYDLWHALNPSEILSGGQLFCFTLGFSQIKEPMDVLWMKNVSIVPCTSVLFVHFAVLRSSSKKLNTHILLYSVALFFDVMRSFENFLLREKLISSTDWTSQVMEFSLKIIINIDGRDDSLLSLDKSEL